MAELVRGHASTAFRRVANTYNLEDTEKVRADIDHSNKTAAKMKISLVAIIVLLEFLLLRSVSKGQFSYKKHYFSLHSVAMIGLILFKEYEAETELGWKLFRKVVDLKALIVRYREPLILGGLGLVQNYWLIPRYMQSKYTNGGKALVTTCWLLILMHLIISRHYFKAATSTEPVNDARVALKLINDFDRQHQIIMSKQREQE